MPATWYAVLTTDSGTSVTHFESAESLADYVRAASTGPHAATVHVFCGVRVSITKGPHRYLLVPDADPLPLFETPVPLDIDEEPSFGGDLAALYKKLTTSIRPAPSDDGAEDESTLA